jgi:hypothetical protein
VGDAIVGTPDLEGKDRLQILAFEENPIPEGAGQRIRFLERSFDGRLVDTAGENLAEEFLHGRIQEKKIKF